MDELVHRLAEHRLTVRCRGRAPGAPVRAGCGAGRGAATAEQVGKPGGAGERIGPIALRNIEFVAVPVVVGDEVHPAGATAPPALSIVNTGREPDRLVAVESPSRPRARSRPAGSRCPPGAR